MLLKLCLGDHNFLNRTGRLFSGFVSFATLILHSLVEKERLRALLLLHNSDEGVQSVLQIHCSILC